MSDQIISQFEAAHLLAKVPKLKSGMTVRVHQRLKEGEKERIQVFEGVVLGIGSGSGIGKSFTVRKIIDGVGVEKVYPFHSPTLEKVEVVKQSKVRRAKLYFLRGKGGKGGKKVKLYEEKAAVKEKS